MEESWVSKTQRAHMQKSKLKTMSICFLDQEGIVHREFVPPGMTVNADFYCDFIRRLRENVRRKKPQKLQNFKGPVSRDIVVVVNDVLILPFLWPLAPHIFT